jgi:hypothetical protein
MRWFIAGSAGLPLVLFTVCVNCGPPQPGYGIACLLASVWGGTTASP